MNYSKFVSVPMRVRMCLFAARYASRQANVMWEHYVYRTLQGDYVAAVTANTKTAVKAGGRHCYPCCCPRCFCSDSTLPGAHWRSLITIPPSSCSTSLSLAVPLCGLHSKTHIHPITAVYTQQGHTGCIALERANALTKALTGALAMPQRPRLPLSHSDVNPSQHSPTHLPTHTQM